MAYSFTEKKRIRKSFAKRDSVLPVPFLLATQLESYAAFLQEHVPPEARPRPHDGACEDDRPLSDHGAGRYGRAPVNDAAPPGETRAQTGVDLRPHGRYPHRADPDDSEETRVLREHLSHRQRQRWPGRWPGGVASRCTQRAAVRLLIRDLRQARRELGKPAVVSESRGQRRPLLGLIDQGDFVRRPDARSAQERLRDPRVA